METVTTHYTGKMNNGKSQFAILFNPILAAKDIMRSTKELPASHSATIQLRTLALDS
jgi:hypothetical protein